MHHERPDIDYFNHTVNELLPSDPSRLLLMLTEMRILIEEGNAVPLPSRMFEMRGGLVEGFSWLRRGKGIGKVVVRVESPLEHVSSLGWDHEGNVLVTGGLGGLGVLSAEVLVELKVQRVVLLSRSGKVKYMNQLLEERLMSLRERGLKILSWKCDIEREGDVVDMVTGIQSVYGIECGVIHSAGLLSDGMIGNQDKESMRKVIGPKVFGAWHMHKAMLEENLDMFVLYSSIASAVGSMGQSNYSSSNAFLDGLVGWRVEHGEVGLCIQWPAVSEVGMAAAMTESRIHESMIVSLSNVKEVLWELLLAQRLDAPVQCCIPKSLLTDSVGLPPSVLKQLMHIRSTKTNPSSMPLHGSERRASKALNQLSTPKLQVEEKGGNSEGYVQKVVMSAVSGLVGAELAGFDMNKPMMEMGLDSLGSTELVRTLADQLKVDLSPTVVYNYPTVESLAKYIAHCVSEDSDGVMETDIREIRQDNLDSQAISESVRALVGVVGASCRLPGGTEGLEMLWNICKDAGIVVSNVPFSRWDVDAEACWDSSLTSVMKNQISYGGFMDRLEWFDAKEFGISDAEALSMDPQQRLLLEYSLLAFQDAKYRKDDLNGLPVGVFAGMMNSDASHFAEEGVFKIVGSSHSAAVGRISFVFGLEGPCVAYDTACSSSLVALHASVRGIQNSECTPGLVLGVNAMLIPTIHRMAAVAGMTSPTGRCHTFGELADGYVRAEGCAAIVLEGVQREERVTTTRYVDVVAVSVSQDGVSASLTAPNGRSQEKLIKNSLAEADIGGQRIKYIEAHGTGTPLGDPIEMGALSNVLNLESRSEKEKVIMGGVKANIGHLEPAAGVAGLLKTFLVLSSREAPPNAGLGALNPKIIALVEGSPVHFPHLEASGKGQNKVLGMINDVVYAGVSSFGYAGTISHAVVRHSSDMKRPFETDVCIKWASGGMLYVLSSHWPQEARTVFDLYRNSVVFDRALNEFTRLCEQMSNTSLVRLMYTESGIRTLDHVWGSRDSSNSSSYTQAALLAINCSLVELWRSRGVEPSAVIDCNVDEICAANVAGCLKDEEALSLALWSGCLGSGIPGDGRVVVEVCCSESDVLRAIGRLKESTHLEVDILVVMATPMAVIVSGCENAAQELINFLKATSHWLHGESVGSLRLGKLLKEEFDAAFQVTDDSVCRVPVCSTVTTRVVYGGEFISGWHISTKADVSKALDESLSMELDQEGGIIREVLEVGPGPALVGSTCRSVGQKREVGWHKSVNMGAGLDDMLSIATVHTRLVTREDDWRKVFLGRRRFLWRQQPHPFLQQCHRGQSGTIYETVFHKELMMLMQDHKIQGRILLPGSAFVEFALSVIADLKSERRAFALNISRLDQLRFIHPFHLDMGSKLECEVSLDGKLQFRTSSATEDTAVCEATMVDPLMWEDGSEALADLSSLRSRCQVEVKNLASIYARRMKTGYHGAEFQCLRRVWHDSERSHMVATVDVGKHSERYHVHPATLDGVFQLSSFVVEEIDIEDVFIPSSIRRVIYSQRAGRRTDSAEVFGYVHSSAVVVASTPKSRVMGFSVFGRCGRYEEIRLEEFRLSVFPSQLSTCASLEEVWVESSISEGSPKVHHGLGSMLLPVLVAPGLEAATTSISLELEALSSVNLRCENVVLDELLGPSFRSVILLPVVYHDLVTSRVAESTENMLLYVLEVLKTIHYWRSEMGVRDCNLLVVTSMSGGPSMSGGVGDRFNLRSLWGLIRTARTEFPPDCHLVCVDIDDWRGNGGDKSLLGVASEIIRMSSSEQRGTYYGEDVSEEVMYRSGVRYTRTLRHSPSHHNVGLVTLRIQKRGRLENIIVETEGQYEAGPVWPSDMLPKENAEVKVCAVGLNFKDLLNALLPDEAAYIGDSIPLPGADFAGKIMMVPQGREVSEETLGTNVWGLSSARGKGMLRSRAVVSLSSMGRMPHGMSFEEAGHIPMVFATVGYALGECACLDKDEKLLVHSGSGGVGTSAVQFGNRVGAVVHTTASDSKREFLQALGVSFISSSRNATIFQQEMRRLTGSEGFHVVLNSLTTEEFIKATVSVVRINGRMVEIGKRNIWSGKRGCIMKGQI